MKNRLITFFNVCMILMFIAFWYNNYSNGTGSSNSKSFDSKTIEINILVENDISANSLNNVQEGLQEIPNSILKDFKDSGWNLLLVKNIDTDNFELDASTSGIIDYDNKSIEIKADELGNEKSVTLHEMGHFFDYKNSFISESDEFKALYAEYADTYIEDKYVPYIDIYKEKEDLTYSSSSCREMFASLFEQYVVNPTYLQSNYPELYNFINQLM